MNILSTALLVFPEVQIITIKRYGDERGYFVEVFRDDVLHSHQAFAAQASKQWVQINESVSTAGVARGLHTQVDPHLDKLLRVVKGSIVDVILDIRPNSPTYGQAATKFLRYNPTEMFEEVILIPFGFAHGVLVIEDCHIQYYQTGHWNSQGESALYFKDSEIAWQNPPLDQVPDFFERIATAQLSAKDDQGYTLQTWRSLPLSQKYLV